MFIIELYWSILIFFFFKFFVEFIFGIDVLDFKLFFEEVYFYVVY